MFKYWLKNVNKLYISSWKVCVYLYTYFNKNIQAYSIAVVKNRFLPRFVLFFSATVSTHKKTFFYLLERSFSHYPHNLLSLRLINK